MHRNDNGTGSIVPRMARWAKGMAGFLAILLLSMTTMLVPAYADMRLGDTEVHGYTPSEMASTDGSGPTAEKMAQLPGRIEQMVVVFIRYMMPFLAIGAVVIIVYNVIANFFRAEEDKVPMSKIFKDIVQGFFFILFAWIIVELILYFLIGTESFVEAYLLG